MKEDQIRNEVAACVRMLEFLGLIDYSGHVSCRIPGAADSLFINAWGAGRHALGPGDIIKMDLDGNPLVSTDIVPSEKHIHTSVYRARPDVNAVAHLHPPVTTALSAAGKAYLPVMHHGAIFADGVPVYDDCRHVNTVARGDAVAALLGPRRRALIMRGHGAVVVAESVRAVFYASVYLEDNAEKLAEAYKIGQPVALREEELELNQWAWREPQFQKVWNYYQEKTGINFGDAA
ncbi:MAG: class II aldolase/adducin family protein [Desulfobacterales bacterium]|nr:class II aldolase/adducin family protein [Desulfobacterales bacterium]